MKEFQINISPGEINELNARLGKTRWINETTARGWGDPTLDVSAVKELTGHLRDSFDWKSKKPTSIVSPNSRLWSTMSTYILCTKKEEKANTFQSYYYMGGQATLPSF